MASPVSSWTTGDPELPPCLVENLERRPTEARGPNARQSAHVRLLPPALRGSRAVASDANAVPARPARDRTQIVPALPGGTLMTSRAAFGSLGVARPRVRSGIPEEATGAPVGADAGVDAAVGVHVDGVLVGRGGARAVVDEVDAG
ncbi:hypothetical protein ACHAXT_002723 [Thalassiosira profunda]